MVALRVPASLACRSLVLEAVRTCCQLAQAKLGAGLDERFVHELTTAVGEAFNNVVLHAYGGNAEGIVEIELTVGDHEVVVAICHDGVGIDIDTVPAPQIDALPESGMGIFLIRATVDEAGYEPDNPRRMILRKRLERG